MARRPDNRFAPPKPARTVPATKPASPARTRPAIARPLVAREMPAVVEAVVDRLGTRGDGIAETRGTALFLPLTVPGDRVRARPVQRRGDGWAGMVEALLAAGPQRATPPCPHFGLCGGCTAQHLADPLYASWKNTLLLEPLRRIGLDLPEPLPWHRAAPGTRRRVTLALHGAQVGFNQRASHDLVTLSACAIATPAIVDLLPHLRGLAGFPADATVLDTGAGLDIAIAVRQPPEAGLRRRAARWSAEAGVLRLSWASDGGLPEILALHAAPRVDLGVPVEPAPGGFLQPTLSGEQALRGFVTAALSGSRRVTELFSGCGTFTFALALSGITMHAVEGDAAAVAALETAAARAGLGGRLRGERRDLARQPLTPEEFGKADAILLDPPRSGAAEQIDGIARSAAGRVVYVSCSPASFARDVRLLANSGFRLTRLLPVDQFLWSPHVELAAVLER